MTGFIASASDLFAPFDRSDLPGATVIVLRDGAVVHQAAYGAADLERGVPCTPATNFRLASVSKQFTAAAVMLLAARGLLAYDDSIGRFFAAAPSWWGPVRVRHLLTHTSGLPDYEGLIPKGTTGQLRTADVLSTVASAPLAGTPGAAYHYSNTAYCLLALLVERVAGQPFAAFLREQIFRPLGMHRTVAYEPGVSEVPDRAYGYSWAGDGHARTDQNVTSATLGDGGIYSSVEELARWDAALAEGSLLDEAALARAFEPAVAVPRDSAPPGYDGLGYGFGWYVGRRRGERVVFHTGETIGFRSAILRSRDRRLTVVVLCNRSEATPLALAGALADLTG
jgi:CubicO group peptidase (beta-lactamase class C family)